MARSSKPKKTQGKPETLSGGADTPTTDTPESAADHSVADAALEGTASGRNDRDTLASDDPKPAEDQASTLSGGGAEDSAALIAEEPGSQTSTGNLPGEAADAPAPGSSYDSTLVSDTADGISASTGTVGPETTDTLPSEGSDHTLSDTSADTVHGSSDDILSGDQDTPRADDAASSATPPASPVLEPVPVEQPRVARGPGFVTLLLGGVLAGAIGYAFATYGVLRPQSQAGTQRLQEIAARLDDQSARLDTLAEQATGATDAAASAATQSDLTALQEDVTTLQTSLKDVQENVAALGAPGDSPASELPDLSGLPDQVNGLGEQVNALNQQVSGVSSRLDEIATTLDGKAPAEALSDLESRLAALQDELDSQKAAVADAKTAAETETNRIATQAALAKIGAALQNGEPYVEATSELQSAGGITVPEGLSASADTGVATLASLQESFPPAARRALTASIRETSGGGALDRFGAFLKAQTGARSLDAKEGDDPDAILSRAEAATKQGDLQTALDEIGSLPDSGQREMADWTARAQARLAATSALADLTATQNSN
ncbi:COG4223 family protein [Oceaniglobus roseus]|uniref:COG4223 family protein n=1 Tax=Oceaniglobus roseus TaxID=1737570 RepID=UPI0013000A05|nr:hypothetical protein [Kandeliimicrobium roseum]